MILFHPSLKTLSLFLDQQLTADREAHIEKHLDKCNKCRKRIGFLQACGVCIKAPAQKVNISSESVISDIQAEILPNRKEVIAEIKAVLGMVLIKSKTNNEALDAFPGCCIYKGDVLQTGENSRAVIEWDDGSLFYINQKTILDFYISSFPLTLHDGEIFSIMNPRKKLFNICTPAAVISVVGTTFDIGVNQGKDTSLCVLNGEVVLKNKVSEVRVKKNQQIKVEEHTRPVIFPIQNKANIGHWINLLEPKEKKDGVIMKKIMIGILAATLLIAGYFAYQIYFTKGNTSSLSDTVKIPETENAYIHYEKLFSMFPGPGNETGNAILQLPKDPNAIELIKQKRQPTIQDSPLLQSLVNYYKPALEELEQGAKMEKCSIPTVSLPKGKLTMSDITSNKTQFVPPLTELQNMGRLLILRGKLAELENRPEDAINDYCLAIKLGKQFDQTLLVTRLVGLDFTNKGSQAMLDFLAKPESIPVAKTALVKIQESGPLPLLDLNSLKDYEIGLRVADLPDNFQTTIASGMTISLDTVPIAVKYKVAYAKHELACLAAAYRVYQGENQKLPDKMESLVPSIMHELPQDPFSQQSFLNLSTEGDIVLYSIGPDMNDEHVQTLYDPINGMTSGGDIVARLRIQ